MCMCSVAPFLSTRLKTKETRIACLFRFGEVTHESDQALRALRAESGSVSPLAVGERFARKCAYQRQASEFSPKAKLRACSFSYRQKAILYCKTLCVVI